MSGGRLLGAALVVLLASACASGDEQPTARASGQQASPTARSSSNPTASASASPSAALEESPCRVKGFTPSTRTVLRRRPRTSLYAVGLTLAPGTGLRGREELTLLTSVRTGVQVVSPEGVTVDPAVLRGVAGFVDGASTAPLPGQFYVRRAKFNRSGRDQQYAQHVTARVYRGTWSAGICGGLTNDGTSVTRVRGTFTSIGPTRFGITPCDRVTSDRPAWVRRLATVCE